MKTIDDLRKEKEESVEWESNAIKRAIQHIIKEHLNNDNYRKKSPADAYGIVEEAFRKEGVLTEARYISTAQRILRKMKNAKSINESVVILGEYLLT